MKKTFSLYNIYGWIMIILPIFCNYRIFPIPSMYVFFTFGLLLMITSKKNTSIDKSFLVFMILTTLTIIVQTNIIEISMRVSFIRLVYYVLFFFNVFFIAYKVINFRSVCDLYIKICIFLSVLIIVQWVLDLFGNPVSLIIPNMTVSTVDKLATNYYRTQQVAMGRYSTFFLEPAHQAQYVLPCLGLILFDDMRIDSSKKNILIAMVLSIGLVLSTSMQGILGAVIIWLYYIYILLGKMNKKNLQRLLFLFPVLFIGSVVLMQQPIIQEQFQKKISSLKYINTRFNTSLYVRVFIGWDCFKETGIWYKLFGCGSSSAGDYLIHTGIGYIYYSDADQIGYMSGASKFFIEYGIMGFCLFCLGLKNKLKPLNDKYIFVLLLSWLILMLTSDSFISFTTMLPLTLIFCRHEYLLRKK